MIVLGINAYHGDSSACLVIDGVLINAIEEERINRIKHWAGLPIEAIKWCLGDANIDLSEIDFIAIAKKPSAHLYEKLTMALTKRSMGSFVKERLINVLKASDIKTDIAKSLGLKPDEIKAEIENVEHHIAHISSAFLVSPFNESVCVSVDGFGDFLSTLRAIGNKTKINIIDYVEYPDSLGIFYTALTQYLGFKNYGDEYKIMGLSAYGKGVHVNEMRKIVKLKENGLFELDISYFIHGEKGVEMVWEKGIPVIGKLYSEKLVEVFGKAREPGEELTQNHQD